MKIEINKQTISDLFKIFQRSLQYNANLLEIFTFFIIILTECKNIDDEIEKMNVINIQKKFLKNLFNVGILMKKIY